MVSRFNWLRKTHTPTSTRRRVARSSTGDERRSCARLAAKCRSKKGRGTGQVRSKHALTWPFRRRFASAKLWITGTLSPTFTNWQPLGEMDRVFDADEREFFPSFPIWKFDFPLKFRRLFNSFSLSLSLSLFLFSRSLVVSSVFRNSWNSDVGTPSEEI